MGSAEKLGIPQLGFFWDKPELTFLWTLTMMWVMVNLLFAVEGRFLRPRFYGFAIGDSPIGLPLIALGESLALRRFDGSDRFYTQAWWHVLLLVVGVGASIALEVQAVMANRKDPKTGYTLRQEFHIAKIWHTVFFGVVFALLAMGAIPLFAAGTWWQVAIAAFGLVVWIAANVYDQKFRNVAWLMRYAH